MTGSPTGTVGPAPGSLSYRAIRLAASGAIEGVDHIEACDDDEAKALAALMANGHGIDLWERSRLLASFPPLSASAPGAKA